MSAVQSSEYGASSQFGSASLGIVKRSCETGRAPKRGLTTSARAVEELAVRVVHEQLPQRKYAQDKLLGAQCTVAVGASDARRNDDTSRISERENTSVLSKPTGTA